MAMIDIKRTATMKASKYVENCITIDKYALRPVKREVDVALDRIRARFGRDAIVRASLIDRTRKH